jgi:predicted AAA+ superfamily ATPase
LIGPRQTGKTTIARQIISKTNIPFHYAWAEEPALRDREWIEQQIACTQQHMSDVRSFNGII